MSQAVIDDVVQGWDGMFKSSVDRLQARVRDKLASLGVGPDDVDEFSELFSDLPHPFDGLETQYKQDRYYRKNMGLVVSEKYSRTCVNACHLTDLYPLPPRIQLHRNL